MSTAQEHRTSRDTKRGRADIQALRALAVAAVLAYHAMPAVLPGGYVGVDIFFVISGFVITSLMISEISRTGRLDFAAFYARRARRILPAATATVIAVILATLALLPLNRWQAITADAAAASVFGLNWRLASGSVDYLQGGQAPSPLQHFWSLGIEEQFYFLWPVLLVGAVVAVTTIARRRRVRVGAAVVLVPVIAISLAYSVTEVGAGNAGAYFLTTTRAWQLGCGALLAAGWPVVSRLVGNTAGALSQGNARRRGVSWALGCTGAGLIAVSLVTYSGATAFPGWAAVPPTLGTALLIATARPAAAWVRAPAVQWLGAVSYSLYLVHWPVTLFLPTIPGGAAVRGATVIGTSLLLAQLSYRYIEQGVPKLAVFAAGATNRRVLLAGASVIVVGLGVAGGGHAVWSSTARTLDVEAEQLIAEAPLELGAPSLRSSSYSALLPGWEGTAPSRAAVRDDLPESHAEGCLAGNVRPDTPMCEYGDPNADTSWVLVGDSHMDQYLPAFTEIAADRGIRLLTFLHANCPFTAAQSVADVERGDPCKDSNAETMERIHQLDPDVVFTSNWTRIAWADGLSAEDGFAEFWSEIDAPVIVLADNPEMLSGDRTTECVLADYPATENCARPRADAMPVDHQLAPISEVPNVQLLETADLFCTETECPPVIGAVMVYRDEHHITATYMRTLVPELESKLGALGVS